LAYHGLDG